MGIKDLIFGKGNRVSAAPYGSVFVRDVEAARAAAIAEKVALFEEQGVEVPEHLAALAAEAGEPGDVVLELVADDVTQDAWRLCDEPVGVEPVGAAAVEVVEDVAVEADAPVEEVEVEAVEFGAAEVEAVEAEVEEAEVSEVAVPRPRKPRKPRANN